MTKMASVQSSIHSFFCDKYTFMELLIEREYPTENPTAEKMNIKVLKAKK